MDSAYLPAVAALGGSIIGGLRRLPPPGLLKIVKPPSNGSGRQKLCKEFIDEAARLYGDALAHNEAAVSDLVRIQALVSRMRVFSSSEIVEKARARRVFRTKKTFSELCDMVNSHEMILLRDFSVACRQELRAL